MRRVRSFIDTRSADVEAARAERRGNAANRNDPSLILSSSKIPGAVRGSFGTDWGKTYQVMEGVGGSITWYGDWVLGHKDAVKTAILDHVFSELKPSIIRIRNCYKQGVDNQGDEKYGYQKTDELMEETRTIIEEGRKRLGDRGFEILMCSWTPPAELKKSGRLLGTKSINNVGTEARDRDLDNDTLAKDDRGVFKYREFAKWWTESLEAYDAIGIRPKWVSIQNEPDWSTEHHPVCLFDPSESFFRPGYYKAFDLCYDFFNFKLKEKIPRPEMIAPETTGFDNFSVRGGRLVPHWYSGHPRVAAIGNHLYDAGVRHDEKDFFKKLDVSLKNTRQEAIETDTKNIFMTEYANLQNHKETGSNDPLLLAKTVYNTLAVANASMYMQWDLLWGRSDEGSLLVVDNPWKQYNGRGYQRTHSFHWYRHFCMIRPYMQRIGVKDQSPDIKDVLILVFQSKTSNASTVILINTSKRWMKVQCRYLPNEMDDYSRQVYYSTLTEDFKRAGTFPKGDQTINLKPFSITSLVSGPHAPAHL